MPTAKRKCTMCGEYFPKTNDAWIQTPVGWFHNHECAFKKANLKIQRAKKKQLIQRKKEHREKLKEVKPLSHWLKLTQKVVNEYIRHRDKDRACISCGRTDDDLSTDSLRGSVWDAGHFKTVGGHPELRFDTRNINKQCRKCNGFEGGQQKAHELGIAYRYGRDRVEWLNGPHEPKHYDRHYLERMRKVFNKKMRMRGWK